MDGFTIFDLGGLVAVSWVVVRVLGPMASAFAKRLEGRTPVAISDPAVPRLQEELDQLQERLDFLERALASRPPAAELPQHRTPV